MIKYVVLSHKGKDGGSIEESSSTSSSGLDGGSIDDD